MLSQIGRAQRVRFGPLGSAFVPEPLSVSILIPAFDAAATLPSCLASVLRQRESRWECVIVDDGSADATAEIALHFASADARIRLLERPHRGIVATLNDGLASCRAPIVARMDADDWMHRDRLACQLEALRRRPELAAVGCHVRIFPRSHLRDGRLAYERWLNDVRTPADVRREAFVECPIAHPTLAVRRDVLSNFGWRDHGWPEDYDLLLRLLARGEELGVVPRRLLGWRDEPGRLSRTDPAYAIERFTECKASFLAGGLLAHANDYVLWGYGDTGRSLRRALLEHGKQPSHIVELHPGRLGQRIHGAPVVAPEAIRELPELPVVASVAGGEARRLIRQALDAMGRRETIDYVCAA
jgi:cellulose synthase/poly-beta-1,6-N-acetylglucosamine synthase-like glycosyltransferase